MKRLIKSSQNTDTLLMLLKSIVNIEQISGELAHNFSIWKQEVYGADNATNFDRQELDEWFELNYDTVILDCINNAKTNEEFNDKYNNLQIAEINEFDTQLKNYIINNADTIKDMMEQINLGDMDTQTMPQDTYEDSDIVSVNDVSKDMVEDFDNDLEDFDDFDFSLDDEEE